MKNDFKSWFASLPAVPGVIACGVRQPNGKWGGFSDEKNFPAEKIGNLLQQFAELHEPLAPAELPARWTTWVFEYGQLRFVPRPDQWLLLLVVSPETEAAQGLDHLSEIFLALPMK
jgi:hypothetical protein